MKTIPYTIVDSHKNQRMFGIIISFDLSYNEYNIKKWISFYSRIPIESIKQLYKNNDVLSLKYDISSFNANERIYAEVSDLFFILKKNEIILLGNKRKIADLDMKNQQLQREIQNEKEIRVKEEQKIYKFKVAFEESKKNIEKINLEKSKEYINKLIANKFVKEFEYEEGKKNSFTISLIECMKNFNKEYMTYCSKFINSLKANEQKIVNEFNIKDSKILIEHINFIVIGKSGIGKSTFINESLLLSKEKKAKEGIRKSITKKSSLYESDKLKMVRMWDTQGLDYKISQEFILNEVKNIIENGLKKGPDHYINIILYCITGERFHDEDGKLIYEIMKLYPSDNLPAIITQLQSYFIERAKNMQKEIRTFLYNYLDKSLADKIEIRDIVARDQKVNTGVFKARGIPELLRISVELMGKAITSSTCKKFSQEIEKICKDYVEKKINFIEQQFKNEMELLDVSRNMYAEDIEDLLENSEKKQIKALSEMNIYSKIEDKKYFEENFIKIMKNKFIDIYNNLNDTDILNENKEIQEHKEENEKIENQNNEEYKQKNQSNKENKDEIKNESNKENKEEDKPLFLFFIEDRLQKLKHIIYNTSQNVFEKIFKKNFQDYYNDLQKEQSSKTNAFGVNCQIIDISETEKNFKEELFIYFNNVFFKNIFCIILKLFKNNLKNQLIDYYKKELQENGKMQQIINKKAEDSLKNITQKLQESLLKELNEHFKKKNKPVDKFDDFDDNNLGFDLINNN